MNFAVLSEIGDSRRGRAAVMQVLEGSPVLRYFDEFSAFKPEATESTWTPVNPNQDVQTRGLNKGYTQGIISGEETKQADTLRFHGGSVAIDKSLLSDANNNRGTIRAYIEERMPAEMEQFAEGYERLLIQGDGTADTGAEGNPLRLKGLRYLIDGVTDFPGYPGVKGFHSAAHSKWTGADNQVCLDLRNSANYFRLLKMIKELMKLVPGANGIIMHPNLASIVQEIGENKRQLQETTDNLGFPITTISKVRIVETLPTSMDMDEPSAADEDPDENCTSLYIVRASENHTSIITNSGLSYNEYDVNSKTSGAEEWEIRSKIRRRTKNCIIRVGHIRIQ